ncbi:MAG: NAD-dependent epimerase/dehydratase family protein [Cycloclasticus sp.]
MVDHTGGLAAFLFGGIVPYGEAIRGLSVGVQKGVGVLGATSLVGACLLPQLVEAGYYVNAFSRQPVMRRSEGVVWRELPLEPIGPDGKVVNLSFWICVLPLWVLPDYFSFLERSGVSRIIVLSSTSRFTKAGSSNEEECLVVKRLTEAEACINKWALANDIECIILRPTLIYGLGGDKNIGEISRIIGRFGFFPLFGKAKGLRQPIHANDVARASILALGCHDIKRQEYNISGGEVLSYREMVERVFHVMQKRPFFISVPLLLFKVIVLFMRLVPRYQHWTAAMAERMNEDLVFEHDEALRDFGFKPRLFELTEDDIA